MASESKLLGRAGNLTVLVLSIAVLVAAGLGARGAFARWQPAAATGQSSGRVLITSDPLAGLSPGVAKRLVLTLRNQDPWRRVTVRNVLVRDVATSNAKCLPAHGNLFYCQYSGPSFLLPAGATRQVTVIVGMPNTVGDACQRATFTLRYSAGTWFR